MSVMRGRRLAPVGALESYTVTRPAPTEHSGLTTVLPTTEPGTSQISVTVASGDFYLPAGLTAAYIGFLLAQVLNNDASSRTVSYRMLKNGSSVATGSLAVSASQRGRFQASFSPSTPTGDDSGVGVVAGDVLELRLWAASSTNVQLVYWTYYLVDTRTKPKNTQAVRDFTQTNSNYPTLASWPGGGSSANSSGSLVVGDNANSTASPGGGTYRGLICGGYGLIRASLGDASTANNAANLAGASPTYIASNFVYSTMSLRRVPVF